MYTGTTVAVSLSFKIENHCYIIVAPRKTPELENVYGSSGRKIIVKPSKHRSQHFNGVL